MTATPPNDSQPQPYQYAQAPAGERFNVLSIIALVAAFVFPLAGIICGHISLGQIKRTGEKGHGLALAGTILGYVFTAFYIIGIVIYVVVIAAIVSSGDYSTTY
jgi:amino acid transporter